MFVEHPDSEDRRRFPRVAAPVLCRPARLFGARTPIADIGLGGVRLYSDAAVKVGKRLEIELFLPGGQSVTATCRVAWTRALPADGPARFDVGLEFLELPAWAVPLLREVLEPVSGAGAAEEAR
jgi:hypothetical protein